MKKCFRWISFILIIVFAAVLLTGCVPVLATSMLMYGLGEAAETAEFSSDGSYDLWDYNPGYATDNQDDYAPDKQYGGSHSDSGIIPFDEIEYVRPDIVEICDEIDECREDIKDADSYDEAKALADRVEEITDGFSMLYAYASIQSSVDKSDEYWKEEYEYMLGANTEMCESYDMFRLALSKTEYKDRLEDELYYEYFEDIPDFDKKTYERLKGLENDLALLINDYMTTLTVASVRYDGKTYTASDVFDNFSFGAFNAWYDKYNPVLGEMYIQAIKLRNEIAGIYGYDSYLEMFFDKNYKHSQITPEMLEELIDGIIEYVVPVYREQGDAGYYYNPDFSVSYDDFSDAFYNILCELDPQMADVYDTVEYYGYMDTDRSPAKESGAYSTYLYKVNMPFIFANYDEDGDGFEDIIHEFGHCYEMYMTDNMYPSSLDTEELFSQGLSVLVSNHYSEFADYPDDYELQYDFLSSEFSTFITQPYYTAMELEIYSMDEDELTVDKINDISEKYALEFGLCNEGDGLYEDVYRMDWVRVNHMMESPFYTYSYATSEYVVLQLFELAREDEQAAVEAFDMLMNRDGGFGFIDNIEYAGFESPFEDGAMEKVADFGRKYLIEENW